MVFLILENQGISNHKDTYISRERKLGDNLFTHEVRGYAQRGIYRINSLKDNRSDEVLYVEVESMADSKATILWRGQWQKVKESLGWKLSDADIKLVDTEVL